MFQTDKQLAKIASFTPIAEKHGDENKLAASLKFELSAANSALDAFSPKLRKFLFRKAGKGEQQDLIEGTDGLVALEMPRLGALSWDEEFPGYEIEIAGGLHLAEPIVQVDVTLKKFRFEPLEGGSVLITFSAVFHPDAEEAGALCALIQDEVELTLTPPTKQEDTGAAQADFPIAA